MFSSPFTREANEILFQIYTDMYRPKLVHLARDLEVLNKELIGMMMAPVLPFAAIPDLWNARKALNTQVTDLARPGVSVKTHTSTEVAIAQLHQKLLTSEVKRVTPPSWTSEKWILPLPNAFRLLKPFTRRKKSKRASRARQR